MKHFILILILACVTLGFQSCSTDFDPNAEWSETTLVYGLIDQDQDTTFLRIQKCFLGSGNLLRFAQNIDSNCYPDGELEVKITEWTVKTLGGTKIKDQPTGRELTFIRTVLQNKPQGEFFSPEQPIYFSPSKKWYQADKIYALEVKNIKSGNIVTSETYLIPDGITLLKPDWRFAFSNAENPAVNIEWSTVTAAKIYQPIVRVNYMEENTQLDKYLDIKLDLLRHANSSSSMMTSLYRSSFGFALTKYLNDGVSKVLGDSITIIITAATEDLSNYMNVLAPSSGIVQERPTYTNINNGIGIFTARRTEIKFNRVITGSVRGYVKGLEIGFE